MGQRQKGVRTATGRACAGRQRPIRLVGSPDRGRSSVQSGVHGSAAPGPADPPPCFANQYSSLRACGDCACREACGTRWAEAYWRRPTGGRWPNTDSRPNPLYEEAIKHLEDREER